MKSRSETQGLVQGGGGGQNGVSKDIRSSEAKAGRRQHQDTWSVQGGQGTDQLLIRVLGTTKTDGQGAGAAKCR